MILALVAFAVAQPQAPAAGPGARPRCERGGAFRTCYQLIDSIELTQPGSNIIAKFGGLAITSKGNYVVADVSDLNLKLYSPRGQWVSSVGRSGRGPGEFKSVARPVADQSGRVTVFDAKEARISVFGETLSFLRSTTVEAGGYVTEVLPDRNGRFFVLGVLGDSSAAVFADLIGRTVRRVLPVQRIRYRGEDPVSAWRALTFASGALCGDTLVVVSSVTDSAFFIDRRTSGVRTERLPTLLVDGRRGPPVGKFSRSLISAWFESLILPSAVFCLPDGILVRSTLGPLGDGKPTPLALRSVAGWRVFTDAPPIIAVRGPDLVALLGPALEAVSVGVFRRRFER